MKEMMEKLREASIKAILETEDVDSLENLRVKYLGKKGELTGILRQMGRLSAEVAKVLRGKNKPTYTPFLDTGDYVIVVNADKITVTGKKMEQKIYFRHSEYVGSAKYTSLREMMQKKPVKVIEHAVRGMLPKGRLGDQMYTKLHVYAGAEHPHAAQKPEELKF